MTFAELMAYSKVEAAQYAIDCWVDTEIMWMSAKDFVAKHTNWAIEVEDNTPSLKVDDWIATDTSNIDTSDWAEIKLSKEDLQELLKANNIKFGRNSWEAKLMILAQENGLL
jgi:hypothetical protein